MSEGGSNPNGHSSNGLLLQVVSFCALKRDLGLVRKGLNCLLPSDIRVVDLQEESHTFNARHRSAPAVANMMM